VAPTHATHLIPICRKELGDLDAGSNGQYKALARRLALLPTKCVTRLRRRRWRRRSRVDASRINAPKYSLPAASMIAARVPVSGLVDAS
jgi:hypothetical protein